MAPTTSAVAGTAHSSADSSRTGFTHETARARARVPKAMSMNGHGPGIPIATAANPTAPMTRKRPSCERRRMRNHRPMSAYQPTHFEAAARPIMTPTSGRTHHALRSHRPPQMGQNNR